MKKQLLIISTLFFSMLSFSQGIVFEKGTWKQVLAKAKLTNKPIFVDVYTTWCEPCKKMSNEVFPLPEVGTEYNTNYICYKIDAEDGEGIDLKKKYEVKSYPSYLFITPNGTLFSIAVGSMPVDNFIEVSKTALVDLKDPKQIDMLDKEYPTRKNDPAFLLSYMEKRSKLRRSNALLFDDYLKLLPEEKRISDSIIYIYNKESSYLNVNSFAYKNLLKNKDQFFKKMDINVYTFLYFGVVNSTDEAVRNKNEKLLINAIEALDQIPTSFLKKTREEFFMDYYFATKEFDQYFKYATIYGNNQLNTGSEQKNRDKICINLNNIACVAFRNTLDEKALQNALSWSKLCLDFNPNNSVYVDTYSNLLYKLKRKTEAIAKLEESISKVSNTDDNPYLLRETLRKIKTGERTW